MQIWKSNIADVKKTFYATQEFAEPKKMVKYEVDGKPRIIPTCIPNCMQDTLGIKNSQNMLNA